MRIDNSDNLSDNCADVFGTINPRGGSRNSLRGGGSGPEFFEGGVGFRVQVRGNFHILTSQKNKKTLKGGLTPLPPPLWIRY